jgi:hypothetical protein
MAPTLRIHLVNLTTGKVIDTEPNMGRCLLSPVGEKAALVRIGRSTILDLKTMKETEVPRQGEPPAVLSEPGFWMGNKAILVDMGPAQTHVGLGFYGLKSYDPADGKIAKLSSVGFPIASDAAGTTLLALVDTGAPQKPIVGDKKEATSYYLVCLDARGDIQKKVVCGESFKGSAVISPSGRWIAYDEKGGKDAIITILDIDTGVTASISAAAHPIGATDRGTVVLKQDRVGDDPNTPTALKLLRSGKIVDFIDAACSATVAGDRLFYIVGGGDKAVLTSIDIPEN